MIGGISMPLQIGRKKGGKITIKFEIFDDGGNKIKTI